MRCVQASAPAESPAWMPPGEARRSRSCTPGRIFRRIPNGPEGYTPWSTGRPRKGEGEMAWTNDDAALVVELAKWGAMIDLGDALGRIFADDFDPDAAGINDPPVRTVLNFFETVATLVKNDVLDRDLVYDW